MGGIWRNRSDTYGPPRRLASLLLMVMVASFLSTESRASIGSSDPKALVFETLAYRATFSQSGFAVEPPHYAAGPSGSSRSQLAFNLHSVSGVAPSPPSPWSKPSDGIVVREVGHGLFEQVSLRSRDLKWDYLLTVRPAVDSDLILNVDVAGDFSHEGDETSSELTLAVPSGEVRIGEVVVVDARGAEILRTLPEMMGTRLTFRIPSAVIASAQLPLTVDPVVSPEYSNDPTWVPREDRVAMAAGGQGFLVVSDDWYQSGVRKVNDQGVNPDHSEQYLVPAGHSPQVTWTGSHFMVVWTHNTQRWGRVQTLLGNFSYLITEIYAARVSAAGEVLDVPGIRVSNSTGSNSGPHVASSGRRTLVAWSESHYSGISTTAAAGATSSNTFMRSRFIEPSMALGPQFDLWKTGPETGPASTHETVTSVTWAESSFVVAWTVQESLEAWAVIDRVEDLVRTPWIGRVSEEGLLLERRALPPSGGLDLAPTVVAGKSGFLVVWLRARSPYFFWWDIVAQRFRFDGSPMDPAGFVVAAGDYSSEGLKAAWSDAANRYGVLWSGSPVVSEACPPCFLGDRLAFTTIPDSELHVPDLTPHDLTDIGMAYVSGQSESLAASDDGFVAAWSRIGNGTWGTFVDPEGDRIRPDVPLLFAKIMQTDPVISTDGVRYLWTWCTYEGSGSGVGIFARTVNLDGSFASEPRVIRRLAGSCPDDWEVAWSGERYLLVLVEPPSAHAGTQDGTLAVVTVDTLGQESSSWALQDYVSTNPSIACSETVCFTTYTKDARSYAQRLEKDGTPAPEPIPLHPSDVRRRSEALASGGGAFMHISSHDHGLIAQRFTADELDPNGWRLPSMTGEIDVAFGNATFMIMGRTDRGISTFRVRPDGQPLDSEPILVSPANALYVPTSISWDDSHFVAVWNDYGSVNMRRVASSGAFREATIPVASNAWSANAVRAAPGKTAVVYTKNSVVTMKTVSF